MTSEHRLTVPRSARYYVDGKLDRTARDVWIACHGYGQLASEFLADLKPLRQPARTIVAPEALSRFYFETGFHGPDSQVGATWMTREDRLAEIDDYVRYLDAVYAAIFGAVDRKKAELTVLGFSQGTATVSRWVARGHAKPDRLILWGGLLPPDLDLDGARAALARLELVFVAGRRDRFVDEEKLAAQLAALEKAGLTARIVRHPGGHRLKAEVLADLGRG
jgi:predicted esterase